MAGKRLGIAILGLGRMGQIHARNVVMSGRTRLQWLVRRDVAGAERFVDSLGLGTRCTDPAHLEDVLSDDSVDAVIICSPTSAHEEQVAQCLRAGKGVLCEKPVTPQVKSTQRLYGLAEAAGVPLMCAFHRRFDPGFRGLRSRVLSGELGRLRLVKSSSHDMTPPSLQYIRTSGGIIPDSTIHDLDLCLWIAQSRVHYVTANGHAWGEGVAECGDVDLVTVTLYFQNGVIAVIDNGRQATYGYSQRLEALCDEGSTVVYDPRETPTFVERAVGQLSSPIHSDFEQRYRQAYVNVLEHFTDVMQGKAELVVTGESTVATMKICEAAAESLVTGKHVELDLPPKDALK